MTTKRKQAARTSSPAKTPAATEPKRSTRASASKAKSEDASSLSKRNEVSVKKIKVTDESDFVDEPEVKELADANANSSKTSSSAKASPKKNSKKEKKGKTVQESKEISDVADEPDQIELGEGEFEDEELANGGQGETPDPLQRKPKRREGKVKEEEVDCSLIDPIPEAEARSRWPNRFAINAKALAKGGSRSSNGDDEDSDILIEAKCHYRQARVDGYEYKLGDDAYVQAGEGKDNYICKILEMFEAVDGVPYFRAQWFYRAQDTVISAQLKELVKQDAKRVFFSEVQDDNNLDCLVKPLNIARLPSKMDVKKKENTIKNCDYYFDMLYLLPHCTFLSVGPDDAEVSVSDSGSTISSEADVNATVISGVDILEGANKVEMTMLDLYSGCGAMSTGLCLGSNSAGVKLVTKWALDLNEHACDSLRWNHPETEVRNEYAHDFLQLLKEWQQLCASFSLVESTPHPKVNPSSEVEEDDEGEEDGEDEEDDDSEVFEVEKVLGICYGSPDDKKAGLYFKIKWEGYGPTYDTWEPIEGLSGCPAKLKEFVTESYEKKLLPLPGMVDVICGGPPCQGISGFNRFRDSKNPLRDEKNKQIIVYMDIVQFLKPRFVLMENVVDLFKFSGAHLGRYAFARLVQMNYQARVGLMAAGAYGLAQFRMRAFVWAALPSEKLPQYPLPTHDVVVRGNVPKEFEACFVAYEEGSKPKLEDKLFLADIISDLPSVKNNESSDEMAYGGPAKTEFQQFIRLRKDEMPGSLNFGLEPVPHMLFDHRPLRLNVDDYTRVCRIPKKKGANFRDLPGLKVIENKVELDPTVQRELLDSGKPLVPDYAITFVRGTSSKPFGRLWWDETVPTVVTRAEPHNQIILHPEQDRVLSIRENARLQGFPDYYKLFGPIKQRYMQVGNAVAVPVARALGHSLALAVKGQSTKAPVFILPKGYPLSLEGN